MDFLIMIKNGCDNLTATVSPSIKALGLHMVIALATIMLVWFGVQEALASAQGGPGFDVSKFLNFFLLKVVAAATLSVISHLLITYLTSGAMNVDAPQRLITVMPGLLMLCFIAGFVLFRFQQ